MLKKIEDMNYYELLEVSPRAQAVLDRHRIAALRLSLTHTETSIGDRLG